MNEIKMSDCRFYVNEEERTVVCVIPDTRKMVLNFIKDHFSFKDVNLYEAINIWGSKWYGKLKLPASFMGKAVCAEEDEWNEETGRLIAFSRAKDKCYKSFFKRANMFVQTIDKRLGEMITVFNDFGLKLENKRDMLQAQIDNCVETPEE